MGAKSFYERQLEEAALEFTSRINGLVVHGATIKRFSEVVLQFGLAPSVFINDRGDLFLSASIVPGDDVEERCAVLQVAGFNLGEVVDMDLQWRGEERRRQRFAERDGLQFKLFLNY